MNALSRTIKQIKPTLLSHKIESIAIAIFALGAILAPYRFLEANFAYWLFAPSYFVAIYLSRHYKFAYLASAFVPIIGSAAICALKYNAEFYFNNPKFWAFYAVALIALLSDKFTRNDTDFIKNAVSKILNLALAFGVTILLIAVVSAINLGAEYLFDINVTGKNFWINLYIAAIIGLWPFLFLLFEYNFKFSFSGEILKHILNFILTPTLIIYTALIYLYIANIALISGLPKGGVAIITLVYLLAGAVLNALNTALNLNEFTDPKLSCDILQNAGATDMRANLSSNAAINDIQKGKKIAKGLNFYNIFAYLAVAPVALLWVGIFERVDTYGLTPSRIYLIISAILATIIYALMAVKRLFSYRICAIVTAAAILITFFAVDVKQISLNSQVSRLHAYLKELNLLAQNGEVKRIEFSNLSSKDKIKLTDTAYAIKSLDNNYSLQNNENLLDELTHYGYSPKSANEIVEYRSLNKRNMNINLSGYKNLIMDNLSYEREALQEQGFIEIFKGDRQIVSINMNDHIKQVFEARGLDFYTAHPYEVINKLADDLLVIHTDEGMLVIDRLELKVTPKQGYTLLRATPAFFLEKE